MQKFDRERRAAKRLARLVGSPRRLLTITVPLLAALTFVAIATGAGGALDTSFGNGGKVLTDISGTDATDVALDVAIQRDGKFVVAGYTGGGGGGFALARYATDGSLDTSFGSGGKVVTAFESTGWAVALQRDGKIVVAGEMLENGGAGPEAFALARYNTDGSLDTSFGSGGEAVTNVGGLASAAFDVAIDRNGKIVVAGFAWSGGLDPFSGHQEFALARYNADGSLDTGFGDGGEAMTDIGIGSWAETVAIQRDGKIVVAGWSDVSDLNPGDFALARYNADGSLDTSFGTGGKVTTDISGSSSFDWAKAVAIQHNGKIVVAGSSASGDTDFALARYTTHGRLDPSFGKGGKVTTDVSGSGRSDAAEAVAIQRNGKVVAAGSTWSGPEDPFTGAEDSGLARYRADGRLDRSFGNGGKVITDVGGTGSADDVATAVAVQRDGKIVTAGFALGELAGNFALVRYLGS